MVGYEGRIGVAEYDPAQRRTIDVSVHNHRRPTLGHRLEGWAPGLQDSMANRIGVQSGHAVGCESLAHGALAGADAASEQPPSIDLVHGARR
jgi:hypothetical protein